MNKKNLASLIILVILLALFIYTKVNNHTEKKINFFKADSTKLAKVVISSKDDTLIVVKNGDKWTLDYPVKYKVQKRKIDDIMKALNVKTSNLPISESKEKFDKYNVSDSLGYRIKFYTSSGKLLDDVIIGKSKNYNFCNARRYDSNKIYQLEKNIYWNVKPDVKSWRDRTVFKTPKEEIDEFSVKIKDNNYTFTYKDSVRQYQSGKKTLNVKKTNGKLSSMLSTLSNLTAADFIDNKYDDYKDKFQKPYAQIKLKLSNGTTVLFTVIEDDKSKYILKKDDNEATLFKVYKSYIDKFDKEMKDFK
jgi:hypothetical protein